MRKRDKNSMSVGHGSCYPYEKPLTVLIDEDREPSEFAKELLTKIKSSAQAEVKRQLERGRYVYGIKDKQCCRFWLDESGIVQCELLYDPDERAREKQASRDEDARQLASGEVTREELWKKNSMFSGAFRMLLHKAKRLY